MKVFLNQVIYTILGAVLVAIGVNMFLAPHDIAAGGASGVGILMEAAFGWDRALVVLIMNLMLIVCCFFLLGKAATLRIALGCLIFPIALELVPRVLMTEDRMLSMIYGSIFFGLGAATLYRVGSSSGGSTIPPLILKKYFNLNTSIGLLICDGIVVFFNLIVFGMDSMLLAFLSLIITSIVMGYIESKKDGQITLHVLSDHKFDEIKDRMIYQRQQGVTIIPIKGGYTNQEREMLLMTMDKKEYSTVLKIIRGIDHEAKISSYSMKDEYGITSQV